MSFELEIVDVDDTGKIMLPHRICEKIGIHPHDKLVLDMKDNKLILTKHEGSVFDLQKKKVVSGTLKKSLQFERDIDRAGKKDMPVS